MSTTIKEFLIERSIPDADYIADEMGAQKIDIAALKTMSIDDPLLKMFLPKYGDRLALLNFSKQTSSSKRKSALFDKLMSKVKKNNDDIIEAKTETPNKSLVFKKRSPVRYVEIGWLNFTMSAYKQVRTINGGGTRKVQVQKTSYKSDLIDVAKELFFPDGRSSKGMIDEFSTNLFDFQKNNVPDDVSVGELYDKTGLNSLRFYLATKQTNSTLLSSEISPASNLESFTSNRSLTSENIFNSIFRSITPSPPPPSSVNNVELMEQPIDFYNSLSDHNYFDVPELITETSKLILHRGHIFNELIEAFKHINIGSSRIEFEIILPNGSSENAVDVGGVFKDVLSEFWSSFYEMVTTGCHWKIPVIKHDFKLEEWQAIAKLIFIGWRDVNYLPISLALPFMEYVLCGSIANTQDLTVGFLNTLPLRSKDLLESAIEDFTKIDQDELLDILQEFDCRLMVHEQNIKAVISEIAHKEIIQRPKYIIDIWSEELKDKINMSKNSLHEEYKNKIPTPTNILKNLCCPEKDENEIKRKIFGFLKKFIREADLKLCTKLLRFITGADIITSGININFNSIQDCFSRSPVAHTCTNTLDLPLTYDSFIDLRCELTSLLSSNVWVMDVA